MSNDSWFSQDPPREPAPRAAEIGTSIHARAEAFAGERGLRSVEDNVALNVIAGALLDRFEFLPLSVRYGIASRALDEAATEIEENQT